MTTHWNRLGEMRKLSWKQFCSLFLNCSPDCPWSCGLIETFLQLFLPSNSLASSTENNTLASLLCPYACLPLYSLPLFKSSKFILDFLYCGLVSVIIRALPDSNILSSRRFVNRKWPGKKEKNKGVRFKQLYAVHLILQLNRQYVLKLSHEC